MTLRLEDFKRFGIRLGSSFKLVRGVMRGDEVRGLYARHIVQNDEIESVMELVNNEDETVELFRYPGGKKCVEDLALAWGDILKKPVWKKESPGQIAELRPADNAG